eukprot:CAMPEP_0113553014 /NCGR_PEP_ID=MMETSP0015_2-20120614/15378_1 /TAXON_ID=2838 /ORGANISM="Odontella" /LENGTH=387 /DNA_ID=CAMNT_0000454037 /DNA_START=98 /DNA_END=1261 /DNA_ORIENTATION=- /assembly_acc=CAM_ASM_000160
MSAAKDSCLKNRIKTAMEKNEPAGLLSTAASDLANLGDKMGSAEPTCEEAQQIHVPPIPVSPEDDDTGNARIFPQRLYDILSDECNAACIGWLPHGRGFIINNRKRFAAEVLPKYFKQTKYTSFTRKLNRWDFTRVTRGPEIGAYYHKFFREGEPTLCTQMYCKNERAKFAAKLQQQQMPEVAIETPEAITPAQVSLSHPQTLPQPVEPLPTTEPQKVSPARDSQQLAIPSLPKIHPSLLLSPRAKMLLATQMAAQVQMQQTFGFTQACSHQTQQDEQKHPAASTNAIVDAAVHALYQNSNVQPPSDFSVAAFHRQQAAAATQMAQARAAMQQHQQHFIQQQQPTAGAFAAAMPKLPPSQSTMAQVRMAQAGRNARTKSASYRASAA